MTPLPERLVRYVAPRAQRLGPTSSLLEVLQTALGRSVERIIRSDAAIRVQRSANAVHKARTSVRRLRSDFTTFDCVFADGFVAPIAEKLRWLGNALGEARDADVLLARIERDAATLPPGDIRWTPEATAAFRHKREAAYDRLLTLMARTSYVALLDELVGAAQRPPAGKHADACAYDHGAALLNTAVRRVRRRVRRRSRPATDDELHGIRIKAKYVRYAAEALAPVLGAGAVRLAKAAERLQFVLGDQHDATLAAAQLADNAAGGHVAFVEGELAQRERDAAEAGRHAWHRAWRTVRRRHNALRSSLS